jgi:hypothetical protein
MRHEYGSAAQRIVARRWVVMALGRQGMALGRHVGRDDQCAGPPSARRAQAWSAPCLDERQRGSGER